MTIASSGDAGALASPTGFIAQRLARSGYAALLMDFLVPAPPGTKEDLSRFETGLLAARAIAAVDWTRRHAGTQAHERALRTLSGRAESTSRERLRDISGIAADWYARHFSQTAH